jgi:putative transposase
MPHLVVGGIQWRMLPKEYPKWQSVCSYFQDWQRSGVWKRIPDTLRARVRQRAGRHKHPTGACLDSQSVKTNAVPGPAGLRQGQTHQRPYAASAGRHAGLVLAVVVTAASVPDRDGTRLLVSRLGAAGKKLRRIWVDGGYRGQLLDWIAAHCRFRLQLVLRPPEQKGFAVLPRRWVVERTFAWLTHHRQLSKDYEGQETSSEAMVYIVMIRLMLRRLARN